MSTVPKFTPPISGDIKPAETAVHLRQIYLTLNQHDQAILTVNNKVIASDVDTTSGTSSTPAASVAGVTSFNSESGVITFFPNLGQVNSQPSTAYTVQSSDDGRMILLNNALPVAVTLDSGVTIPWYAVVFNQGSGTATMTPTSGTINGGASLPIPGGGFSIVYFDGTNWEASATNGVAVVPVTFFPILHEFLTGYDDGTGVFSAARPAAVDLSNGTTGNGAVVLATGPIIKQTYTATAGAYAVLASDYQIDCTAGTFTVTLLTAVGITGQVFSIKNSGAGTITLATSLAQTIDGAATQSLAPLANMRVMSNGSNWIVV